MKGVILAGGKGTRLLPATRVVNKHMVPILNMPMIVYPLNTLKHLGVTDIMIVSGGDHIGDIAEFLGDGSEFGVQLTYRVQKNAGGIAQALGLAQNFALHTGVVVILGDNIFDNSQLPAIPQGAGITGAALYLSTVNDPERFGVPVINKKTGEIVRIEEKPSKPQSNFAITGLYVYPPSVFDIIPTLEPSDRGELEISDVNNWYINHKLYAYSICRGFWSDAGTRDSLKGVTDFAYAN